MANLWELWCGNKAQVADFVRSQDSKEEQAHVSEKLLLLLCVRD